MDAVTKREAPSIFKLNASFLSQLESFSIEEKLNFSRINYGGMESPDCVIVSNTDSCNSSILSVNAPEFKPKNFTANSTTISQSSDKNYYKTSPYNKYENASVMSGSEN